MAFGSGSDVLVYANGYDLTDFLSKISGPREASTSETTTLRKTSRVRIPGLKDGSFSADGFFDGSVAAIDEIMAAALGVADVVWLAFPQGDAVGSSGKGAKTIQTSYEGDFEVGEAGTISVEAVATDGVHRVISVHALGAESGAASQSAGIDNAASSANGLYGYALATTAGAAALTGKIQHSVDNVTFADLLTFTVPAAGRYAEVQFVAGTINRYVRGLWTPGAGASSPFVLAFYRVR